MTDVEHRGPVPERVGPYRIERLLGAGGMGLVYAARAANGAPVAVKVLRDTDDAGAARRLEAEGAIRIAHPNVVRVIDAGRTESGQPWIACELLEGEGLDQRLLRGPLPIELALEIFRQASAGVAAAHAAGLVHRDLKPSNLFLCADGSVKVLDFGIARPLAGRTSTLTASGSIVGTPGYLAPEQARGLPDVDARADVWALGVALLEAITGRSPFDRGSPYATLLAIAIEPPPDVRRLLPRGTDALRDALQRCLAKRPEDRHPDARSLNDALAAVVLEGRASAPPVAPADGASPADDEEERVVSCVIARDVWDPEVVERTIEEHGGVLARVLGTDVIGMFGWTAWHGDEAVRAVGAALHCRHAAARVGVGSGRARTGTGGVAGSAVRAAEAASGVEAVGAAIDADTAQAVRERFLLEPIDAGLFEVTGERSADALAPAERAVALVGRRAERARIAATIAGVAEQTGAGGAVAVVIDGALGTGKTALAAAAARLATEALAGARVVRVGCDRLRAAEPYSTIASALRQVASARGAGGRAPRLDPSAPPAERMQAVIGLARDSLLGPSPAPDAVRAHAAFLGEIAGVRMPETPELRAARGDLQLMADRLRLAASDWLAGLAARGPLVLVIDDIQWADAESVAVVGGLAERAQHRAVVIASGRDAASVRGTWWDEAVRITLGPLAIEDAAELVTTLAAAAGDPSLTGERARAVAERAEGNPLFVEQIVGIITAPREAGDAGAPSDPSLVLPITIEGAVQARLDALAPEARGVCRVASIWGRPFTATELGALGAGAGVVRTLTRLADARVVAPAGTRWRFESSLVAEVAYRSASDDARARWHRAAAHHLCALPIREHGEIALHLERAGDGPGAGASHAQAAIEASRRGDGAGVVRHAAEARRLGVPDALAFALHIADADALRFLGRRAEQGEALDRALAAAATDGARALVSVERIAWLARLGRTDDALAAAGEAIAAAGAAADPDVLALAHIRRADVLTNVGRHGEADAALKHALEVEGVGPFTRALRRAHEARWHASRGDVSAARDGFAEAMTQYASLGDERRAAANEVNLADRFNRVGAYGDAERALREALARCRRVGHRAMETYALLNLGWALIGQGRAGDALDVLGQADVIANANHDARVTAMIRVYRAHALAARGDAASAVDEARRAAEAAAALKHAELEAIALGTAAHAELRRGDPAAALLLAERADEIRRTVGSMEEGEADIFLARAEALAAVGRAREAEAVRGAGAARLQDLASRIADPDWRRRFLRDVPAHAALTAG